MQSWTVFRVRNTVKQSMGDLLLFTPSKEAHMNKLEDLLKALLKNGLKISPKMCQLFRTSQQYLGNKIFIENKKQIRSNSEATPTKDTQGMQKFCGCSESSQYVLPVVTKATQTYI